MTTAKAYNDTGLNVVGVIRNAAMQFAHTNSEAMESYNAANIAYYGIAATEIGNTGEYYITLPAWLAVGLYSIQFTVRTGASLAETDMPNRFAVLSVYYDGVNVFPDWSIKIIESASPITGSLEKRLVDTCHTAEQAGEAAASKILATPANKLASNDSGQVEASNIYSLTPIP